MSKDKELQFRNYAASLTAAANPSPTLVLTLAVLSSSSSKDLSSSSKGLGITSKASASKNAQDTLKGLVELSEPSTLRGLKIKGKSRALQVEELEEEVLDPFSSNSDNDLEIKELEEGILDSFSSFSSNDKM